MVGGVAAPPQQHRKPSFCYFLLFLTTFYYFSGSREDFHLESDFEVKNKEIWHPGVKIEEKRLKLKICI